MEFVLGIFAGLWAGFLVGIAVFAGPTSTSDAQKLQVICDYKSGEVKGDVCIKDGSVITIDIPGDN